MSFDAITDSLFLGPVTAHLHTPDELASVGVTHVVYVMTRDCARYPQRFTYLSVPVEDYVDEAPIGDHFHSASDFIRCVIQAHALSPT